EFNPRSDEVAGGVLDVISFGLRLSSLVLIRPRHRKVMILDEPFKNIRGDVYRSRIRSMIDQLSKKLNVQFILNIDLDTYPEFRLGKVIEIEEKYLPVRREVN